MKPLNFLIPIACLSLSSCVIDATGDSSGVANQSSGGAAASGKPLSVSSGGGSVTVRQGGKVVSSFRTASPNVEETHWRNQQSQIAVKSRGNHGPATIQLFDSYTGREVNRIMAYDVRNGKPHWAAGMGE